MNIYTHMYVYIYIPPSFGKLLLFSFTCFSIGKHAYRKITEFVFLTPSKFTFVLIFNNEIYNQLILVYWFSPKSVGMHCAQQRIGRGKEVIMFLWQEPLFSVEEKLERCQYPFHIFKIETYILTERQKTSTCISHFPSVLCLQSKNLL